MKKENDTLIEYKLRRTDSIDSRHQYVIKEATKNRLAEIPFGSYEIVKADTILEDVKTKTLTATTNYEKAFKMLRELTRKINVCEYKSQFNHNKSHKRTPKRRRNVVKRKHR